MIVSLPSRGIGAAALAAGLLLAGCSSDSDVPKTVASAPGGGTQVNTDTGSGGSFPDVNTVPNQRPTSTIQDLNQAPEGLSGAQSGTQYGEPLVGGPTSSAAPPPPPEPAPEEQLAPIPEPGIQTQTSDAQPAPAPEETPAPAPEEPAAAEPIATPEVTEPQPMEPGPSAEAAPDSAAPEGQTIQGTTSQDTTSQDTTSQPAPDSGVQAAPIAPMAAAPQQPAAPVGAPQEGAQPFQPEGQLALSPGGVQAPALGATRQPQMPASAYGPNYAALSPDAYGIAFPQPVLPPYQAYNPAQAMYRSPYASPPTNYGGANDGAPLAPTQTAMVAPAFGGYGQPYVGGQPVGLIYFREGSAKLSPDDRDVLKQIAEMQRANGGVVHVVGHASMRTSGMDYNRHQQANQRISEARANAVAHQLMRYGVPEGAIQTAAAGDSQPLYSEAMPSGEAANRRAEVYLGAY
ncbi:MAG TPA: OmpA family protein [Dongiaceae bacterium]|nr:OmpA family protein [Dongiaceae bacterium]